MTEHMNGKFIDRSHTKNVIISLYGLQIQNYMVFIVEKYGIRDLRTHTHILKTTNSKTILYVCDIDL